MSDNNNTPEDIVKRAEEFYKHLKENSTMIPAVSDKINVDIPPPWFDAEMFAKAQQIAQRNYISLNMSHLIGLLMVVQIPTGLEPLLATGNSKNIPKLYRRYLSTTVHVKSWYESDVYKEGTKGYKSIRQVRKMHNRACEMMNSKTGRIIGKDRIWVSQYEMALTQWAFIAVLMLYPKQCASHGLTESDLNLLNYFWRVIGYLMGIEEQFNLCSGSLQECRALYKIILDREYRPVLSQQPHPAPVGFEMAKGIVRALRPINPALRWQTYLHYFYTVMDIPVEIPLKPWHKIRYGMMRFMINYTLRVGFLYAYFNKLLRRRQNREIKRREETEKNMAKRYPNQAYETKCPFHVDLDYLDAFQTTTPDDDLLSKEKSKNTEINANTIST